MFQNTPHIFLPYFPQSNQHLIALNLYLKLIIESFYHVCINVSKTRLLEILLHIKKHFATNVFVLKCKKSLGSGISPQHITLNCSKG